MCSCRRARPSETERRSQRRPRGKRPKSSDGSRKKRGPGNRKEEARGGGASQCRTHFPSRVRRNPKPPGGRNRERIPKKLRFVGIRKGTGCRSRKAETEGTRQGTEAGRKVGRGTRRNRNRTSDGPAKEPEGPTGAARPRPEPPWESEPCLRARRNGPRDSGGRQRCRPPFRFGARPWRRRREHPPFPPPSRHPGESRDLREKKLCGRPEVPAFAGMTGKRVQAPPSAQGDAASTDDSNVRAILSRGPGARVATASCMAAAPRQR